jgi:hypothetical protein
MFKLVLLNNTTEGIIRLLEQFQLVDASFSNIKRNIAHYLAILRDRIEEMLRKLGVDTNIPEPDLPITPNESAQKVKVLHPTQLQTQ